MAEVTGGAEFEPGELWLPSVTLWPLSAVCLVTLPNAQHQQILGPREEDHGQEGSESGQQGKEGSQPGRQDQTRC